MVVQYSFLLSIIGLRDYSVGADTFAYAKYFENLQDTALAYKLQYNRFEPLFVFLVHISGFLGLNPFGVVFTIGYLILAYACVRHLNAASAFLFILVLFSSFFYFNLAINPIRQYIAINFIIVFFSAKKGSKLLLILAVLSHYSAIFVVFALMVSKLISTRMACFILMLFILVSISGLGSELIIFMIKSSSVFDQYTHIVRDGAFMRYSTGFRPEFVLFSVFLLLAVYCFGENPEELKVLILMTAIFILLTVIPYSDRLGVYVWVIALTRLMILLPSKDTILRRIAYTFLPLYCFLSVSFHPLYTQIWRL